MSCCIGHIFYSRLKALLTLSTSPCPARYPPGSLRIMRCSCLCSSSCHAHDLLTNSSLCIVIGSLSVFQALRFGLHLSSTNDAFICDALSKFRAEFWIQKKKGGFCMSISSKSMSIAERDDRRYWSHISTEESRLKIFFQADHTSGCGWDVEAMEYPRLGQLSTLDDQHTASESYLINPGRLILYHVGDYIEFR